jgi:hypothetical protein
LLARIASSGAETIQIAKDLSLEIQPLWYRFHNHPSVSNGGLDGPGENQTTWKGSGPPRHNPRQFCLDVASGDLQLIGVQIIKANLAATARQHECDP